MKKVENKGFVISDSDLKKFKKWIKSKKGQKAMKGVWEECGRMNQAREMAAKEKEYHDAIWWSKNKDIPYRPIL